MKLNSILKTSSHFNVFLVQPKLLSDEGQITKIINEKYIPNLIFWGPSGCGKTQIIQFLSNSMNIEIKIFHASFSSKKEMETKISNDDVVFIDEIHNLDKRKQDYLMYLIDFKNITLIGATTLNPFYSINPALLSRAGVIEFESVDEQQMLAVLNFHIEKSDYWAPEFDIRINDDTKKYLVGSSNNDIRKMLLIFELIVKTCADEDKQVIITQKIISSQFSSNISVHETKEGEKYNLLSALQKSIRGSDVDASLFYLAKILLLEDLKSVLRRLSVIIFEDIGYGNLDLINRVLLTINHCEKIGLPEARIPLGHIVSEMALSPKDNSSYLAINNAIECAKENSRYGVNENIVNSSKTYVYPFDNPNNIVNVKYLPKEVNDQDFLKIKSKSKKAQMYENRRIALREFFTNKK